NCLDSNCPTGMQNLEDCIWTARSLVRAFQQNQPDHSSLPQGTEPTGVRYRPARGVKWLQALVMSGIKKRSRFPTFLSDRIYRPARAMHPVWSRNSCDPWVVVLEKAAEALSTSNRWPTCLAELLDTGEQ